MSETSDLYYSEDAATFGDRLAAARAAAGMTQKELAKRLGVKPSTMQRWEDDLSEPRANRLSMLSGLLNVSMPWLLTGRGDGPEAPEDSPLPTEIKDILVEIRDLRSSMAQGAERLAVLEKRLRANIKEAL